MNTSLSTIYELSTKLHAKECDYSDRIHNYKFLDITLFANVNASLSTICELSTKLHKKKSNVIRAIDYVIIVPFSRNSCTVAAFLLEFNKHKRPHRRTIKIWLPSYKSRRKTYSVLISLGDSHGHSSSTATQ